MNMHKRLRSWRAGFTLTEVLVTTFIFSLVSLVVFGGLAATNQFWTHGQAKLDAKFQSELALDRIVGEMRNTLGEVPLAFFRTVYEAGGPRDVLGFFPLTDSDGDGTVHNASTGALEYNPNLEIRYVRSGTTNALYTKNALYRYAGGTRTQLASDITSLRFLVNGAGGWCGGAMGPCPAPQTVRVEITSTKQVFDKGGFRPITHLAATTLEVRHEALPLVIPFKTDASTVTNPSATQGYVSSQYPSGSFPQ